jgi:anti-sigma B factor antagonist
MIQFTCTHCHARFAVSEDKAGKQGKCPQCGGTIHVPPMPPAQERPDANTDEIALEPLHAPVAEHVGHSASSVLPPLPPVHHATTRLTNTPQRVREAVEGGEIPLSGGPEMAPKETPSQPQPAATEGGLFIAPVKDALVVSFRESRILDAQVIEDIGAKLYGLPDQQACRKIVLDFGNVEFLSSQMLGVLVTLNKKATAIAGRLVLCSVRSELLKVFQIVKLDRLLKVVADKQAALRVLGLS